MTTPPRRKKRINREQPFSERLARTRALRGLLLTDLATQSGVDKGQLSRLENGLQSRPSAEAVFNLSEALEVRPEWLWRGIEPMEADAAEKRLRELRQHLEQQDVDDEVLRSALKKVSGRFHATVFAVAKTLSLSGERHTLEGWLARFSEIEKQVKPILPR
ncbi:MAG: helix-turn-helix transcriptional regulator [Polyangiaceae bacterium]